MKKWSSVFASVRQNWKQEATSGSAATTPPQGSPGR